MTDSAWTSFKRLIFFSCFCLSLTGVMDSALALASGIAFSLLLGNPFAAQATLWSKKLLQLSVVGLGFGIGIGKVLQDGAHAIGYTIVTISLTLFAGAVLGKLCRVSNNTSHLISFGTAICGGSAIAALAPSIKAKPEEVAVSLATIFTLNALALFVFPLVGQQLQMNQQMFGLWAALAIHDTSSVVGAASSYGHEALTTAVTVKLTRALWIAPCVLLFAYFSKAEGKARIPLFILGFILAACLRTFLPQQQSLWDTLGAWSRHLLVATLFLIGTGLSRQVLKQVGVYPLVQGAALWLLVSIGALVAIQSNWILP